MSQPSSHVVNAFLSEIMVNDKVIGKQEWICNDTVFRWRSLNDLGLIFVVEALIAKA